MIIIRLNGRNSLYTTTDYQYYQEFCSANVNRAFESTSRNSVWPRFVEPLENAKRTYKKESLFGKCNRTIRIQFRRKTHKKILDFVKVKDRLINMHKRWINFASRLSDDWQIELHRAKLSKFKTKGNTVNLKDFRK